MANERPSVRGTGRIRAVIQRSSVTVHAGARCERAAGAEPLAARAPRGGDHRSRRLDGILPSYRGLDRNLAGLEYPRPAGPPFRPRARVRGVAVRQQSAPASPPAVVLVRLPRALLDPGFLADEIGGRRALGDERIGAVLEDGHDGWNDAAGERCGALVVLLDELPHVYAVRAERRAHGWRSGGLARVDLHFDDGLDLLRHRLFHQLFDLQEVQLHRRLAAEDGHEDLHLVPLGVHLVDHAVEIGERPVSDADRLAFGERDLVLRRVQLDLPQDRADLTVGEWRRLVPAAHEARDAWRVAHDVPRVVAHDHLDEHIAREHLLLHRVPLAVLDLDLFLRRHQFLEGLVAHVHRVDAMLEVRLHLVFIARIRVDHIPAPAGVDLLRCRRGRVDDLGLRLGDGNGNRSRLGLGDRPGPAKDLLRLVDRDLFYRLGRPEERTRRLGGGFVRELRGVDVVGGRLCLRLRRF